MRLSFSLVLALACFVIFTSAQNTRRERRQRLQGLIAAAKSGDTEARKALRTLRNKLRSRSHNVETNPVGETIQNIEESRINNEPVSQHIQEDPNRFESKQSFQKQEPVRIIQPQVVPARRVEPQEPIRNTIQSRRPRVRQFQAPVNFDFGNEHLGPHTALQSGLEIDDRSELNADIRVTNLTRTPPIETIRRYSYFDEGGNYIFGYEAADGSFKEEKRGRDCVVNGKYGYVDPDGIKREFNYISGNKCDPDNPVEFDVQGNEINPIPKNDQFLIQTDEQQLDPATLSELNFNRRRKPTHSQARNFNQAPRNFNSAPIRTTFNQVQNNNRGRTSRRRQQNQIENERQGNAIDVNEPNFANALPNEPAIKPRPVEFDTFSPQTERPIRISTFRPQPPSFINPRPQVFRPDSRFDFDTEFNNIFDNFAHQNIPKPRPRPTPSPFTQRPRAPQTSRPRPTPSPFTQRPRPPPTSRPTTQRPTFEETRPRVVFPPNTISTGPKQLVFDSVSGGFKSVPLGHGQSSRTFNPVPPPPAIFRPQPSPFRPPTQKPPTIFRPQPSPFRPPTQKPPTFRSPTTGRPLPLGGFNPLPPVPLGALSIHGSAPSSNFNEFFSHFNI